MGNKIAIQENSSYARVAAVVLKADAVAMVLGNTIHLHRVAREEFLRDSRWLKHELCHIRQYRRYGTIGFLIRYGWECLLRGYKNNHFEAEAREAEALPLSADEVSHIE